MTHFAPEKAGTAAGTARAKNTPFRSRNRSGNEKLERLPLKTAFMPIKSSRSIGTIWIGKTVGKGGVFTPPPLFGTFHTLPRKGTLERWNDFHGITLTIKSGAAHDL